MTETCMGLEPGFVNTRIRWHSSRFATVVSDTLKIASFGRVIWTFWNGKLQTNCQSNLNVFQKHDDKNYNYKKYTTVINKVYSALERTCLHLHQDQKIFMGFIWVYQDIVEKPSKVVWALGEGRTGYTLKLEEVGFSFIVHPWSLIFMRLFARIYGNALS